MSGSLDHSPAEIIANLLIDESLGTAPSDKDSWPIFVAITPDNPDGIITVTDTAPIKQGRLMSDGESHLHHGVQIAVRSASHGAGWTKANALREALDKTIQYTGVTIEDSGYIVYATSHSGIIAVGKNVPVSKRNLFTINAVSAMRQVA